MFYLYNSNRTEILAEQLGAVINDPHGRSLFDTSLFLVQSREMGRMLSQFLADKFGVWCNSEYMLPLRFFEYISGLLHADTDISAYDRAILIWRIERLLRETDGGPLSPLVPYLSGDNRELKRYQLARSLADLFDQYQIMRPNLIDSWNRGRTATDNSAESWQMHLWTLLADEGRGSHRGALMQDLIEQIAQAGARGAELPQTMYVFGIHTLPPMFVSVLDALSDVVDVHFFLLTPCSHYWADLESRRAKVRRSYEDEAENDLEFHPLLSALGRQGADFQHILLEHVGDERLVNRAEVFALNAAFGQTGLLHRLQDDVLEGHYAKGVGEPVSDDSITIVSCHSRIRELTVLRDHVIDWMTADPGLGLHEIVVMAPDIQQYGDLIPALFADIAHDISDCRNRRDNLYFAILSEFLELFTGRYSGPEIIDLIEHPEVGRTFGIRAGDMEQIRCWLADSGIRWGLSQTQRDEDGHPLVPGGSWQDGLERMLLGMASGTTERIGTVIPYTAVEGGDAELLGNLCLFIDTVERSRITITSTHTLAQWSAILYRFTTELFGDDDSPDLLTLQELLTGLGESCSPYHTEEVSFDVIRQWFENEADTLSASGFLRGRLTFCSMLPMRSIPFKVLCLLGVNDGEFPKQDLFSPFNLLKSDYKKGDRSRRADDRYQFLEAIMAARERLYISYIGQSIQTNDELPPSPVVSELIETIEYCYGPIRVKKQPLQPFSERYFNGSGDLFSHSHYYCETAQSLRSAGAKLPCAWFDSPIDGEQPERIELADLESFLRNPQKFFVRSILGMRTGAGEDLPAEHEPFIMDSLENYQVNQDLIQEVLSGGGAADILDALQQRQAWPLGYPGRVQFEWRVSEIDEFIARIREIVPSGALEVDRFELECDACTLTGALNRSTDGGLLYYRYAPLKGADLFVAWLGNIVDGTLCRRREKEAQPTHIVAQDQRVIIAAGSGDDGDLNTIISWYLDGCRYPSKLLVEPAFAYCSQVMLNRGRGSTDPREKARENLWKSITKGYAEELRILFKDMPPESMIGEAFERLCNQYLMKLWEAAEFAKV